MKRLIILSVLVLSLVVMGAGWVVRPLDPPISTIDWPKAFSDALKAVEAEDSLRER